MGRLKITDSKTGQELYNTHDTVHETSRDENGRDLDEDIKHLPRETPYQAPNADLTDIGIQSGR